MPSTFGPGGSASARQHLTSLVVDDAVAFDAGSLAMGSSDEQKATIRDVVISHAHLDHIAGLPLFIDDLFSTLDEPVRIHAAQSVIDVLETHIFNWSVYPRFSELSNGSGAVMEYVPFEPGTEFSVRHLTVLPVAVNHLVPSCGFVVSDGSTTVAMTGDTAQTDEFWQTVNRISKLDAVLIECSFPDSLTELARDSYHLTPSGLTREIRKLERHDCPFYVVNLKPAYRDTIITQLNELAVERLNVLNVGCVYDL